MLTFSAHICPQIFVLQLQNITTYVIEQKESRPLLLKQTEILPQVMMITAVIPELLSSIIHSSSLKNEATVHVQQDLLCTLKLVEGGVEPGGTKLK